MKVWIFVNYDEKVLCGNINRWIEDKDVIDIKYSNTFDNNGRCFYTALITYNNLKGFGDCR